MASRRLLTTAAISRLISSGLVVITFAHGNAAWGVGTLVTVSAHLTQSDEDLHSAEAMTLTLVQVINTPIKAQFKEHHAACFEASSASFELNLAQ